jgi:hypothetical protein
LNCRHVVFDLGYDADTLLAQIEASGANAHIRSTCQQLVHHSVDRPIYRHRNPVKRFYKSQARRLHRHALRQVGHELPRCRCACRPPRTSGYLKMDDGGLVGTHGTAGDRGDRKG